MSSFIVKNMQYVTVGVPRSRIPRQPTPNASNPPGLAQIGSAQILATNVAPGAIFHSAAPAPTLQAGGNTVYYAFTSMSGGTEGGRVTNIIGTQLMETVGPGGADIVQLNVYISHDNFGPGGGPGAIIDAFDEATGTFVDDIFVDVAPDGNGSITHDANYLGAFGTAGSSEVVTAHSFIQPSNGHFDQWLIMPGTGGNNDTVSGANLNVGQNSNVVAFAHYRHPKNLKELAKDVVKEGIKDAIFDKLQVLDTKPQIVDTPLKQIGDTIPHFNPGDPEMLKQYIALLEQQVKTLEAGKAAQGSAFIKAASRPAVGKQVAAKASKRK